jgi:cell division protein FtsI (penicillin-binding protein 3)
MAKPAARIAVLEVALAAALALILARSFQVQVVQHRVWAARVKEQRTRVRPIAARRGRIYDRNGRLLAASEEQYRVTIALNEVRDTAGLMALLPRALDVSRDRVAREFARSYPYFDGPFTAEQVEAIRNIHGVHLTVLYHRVYPMQSLAARILGRLDPDGEHGVDGVEKMVDTLLQGRPGEEEFLVDGHGQPLPVPGPALSPPVPGRDVYLTLDADMQGIAEGALSAAVATHQARGGDVVLLDVTTGELLAVASLRRDTVTGQMVPTASALVEPNEPGSTSKLFTIAALLRTGADTTPVDGEGGHWEMHIGKQVRIINDVDHRTGPVTLGETVKYSSNIAISKFALELKPEQQYESLRDFGFGTPLALGFPGEASGKLDRPARWANPLYSQPSLGQGYEWEATAAQLAAGYGAIANHGVLMQTALVRDVRDSTGTIVWRHTDDTVRRAVPDSIARRLMDYLAKATDTGGTGVQAQLDRYKIVGKTGTAEVAHKRGYRSSFVGIFTRDHPQVVIYIMIDQPSDGEYYGGTVAAPIERTILLQALSMLHTPLDAARITAEVAMVPVPHSPEVAPEPVHPVPLPVRAPAVAVVGGRSTVPGVAGLSVRDAAVLLERAGFDVRLQGQGTVRSSAPTAGDSLPRGGVVTLHADTAQ